MVLTETPALSAPARRPRKVRSAPLLAEEFTARRTLSRGQAAVLLGALGTAAAAFLFDWRATLLALNALAAAFYLLISAHKLLVLLASEGGDGEIAVGEDELAALDESALPRYTILVPLFHEGGVLPRLVQALSELDYPKERLQILLLLEEADAETRAAAEALRLASPFETVVVADSLPRTKPKACNVGLEYATGDCLVIYDAEDRPEPDQLKKAAAGFRRLAAQGERDVICLQAKLDFYNAEHNVMTKWFTTEYGMWYELFLPGLGRLGAPIPLGGTSNHFHLPALLRLGGWDGWNVTEDCDLGLRLARRGFRTRMLDSTTWEEACSRPRWWLRQRSRWIKGYMQTFLVHTRRPFQSARALGFAGFLHFAALTGGAFLVYALNPLFWALTLAWLVFRPTAVGAFFPAPIFITASLCLFVGNFGFIYTTMLGAYRRRCYGLVKYALMIPPYWALISLAAWKAGLQLIRRPHFWEKTKHGLSEG